MATCIFIAWNSDHIRKVTGCQWQQKIWMIWRSARRPFITWRALNPPQQQAKTKYRGSHANDLALQPDTINCISRALPQSNLKIVCISPWKFTSSFHPMKDGLGLRTQGPNNIPCGCGKVYIGQTGFSTKTRVNKHHCQIRHYQLEKSLWCNSAMT
jgi:hypothetical protein